MRDEPASVASPPLSAGAQALAHVTEAITRDGGWWPFDRFMAFALYEPGLGYYARGDVIFGAMPEGGSDFVTAPELSPLFARAMAAQLAQALEATGTQDLWEFGAGSGALAAELLAALGERLARYHVVEVSGALQARQRERLAAFGDRVCWHAAWPEAFDGVVVGNEVLDAMPVQLLHFDGRQWFERGVAVVDGALAWADRPTTLRPPVDAAFVPGTVTEIHPQAQAWVRSLAARLQRGAVFLVDYGFPEAEYWLPQRHGGTLMCHRAHRADGDPLVDVGLKDITAHVDFTGIAVAGQDAGLEVLGYTSQARFLLNCGLVPLLEAADVRERAMAQKLIQEHEMGELFKVIGFVKGPWFEALGFADGDRSHRL
ncbi:MAG: SAM-dependent methyltransferase [Burkholderiaceae bacterium]|nr:SAM-dependent methyltransferase [Burkholderiaceae bacterium]